MEREKIVNAALWPVDQVLDYSIKGFEGAGIIEKASEVVYSGVAKAMQANFKLNNELEISGEENVPTTGGVILACNHQSWLDVQVLTAVCPRRVHFIAKEEFENWPVLRHLI